jgi:hypothetical protein
MPAEVMADIADTMVGMLSNMPLAMLRVDMLVSVLAVDAVTMLRGPHAAPRGLQDAHVIGMAAVTGEAVTGIRPMDIPASAITAWAMAIHTTGLAITVTAMVGTMVRTTTDITLTATDTGRP